MSSDFNKDKYLIPHILLYNEKLVSNQINELLNYSL